jgi:4'-phosphopantetheinyl transferase
MTRHGEELPVMLACVSQEALPRLKAARATFLHPSEMARLERFPAESRRESFLLGRYVAKRAVAALRADAPMPSIEVVSGIFGQPVVRNSLPTRLPPPAVSVSHTRAVAVAAACEPEQILGVDVEALDPRRSGVFESSLTPSELAAGREGAGCDLGPNILWAMKEALSKALRSGLTTSFEVLQTAGFTRTGAGAFTCLFENFAQYRGEAWIIGGHVLALTCAKHAMVAIAPDAMERLLAIVPPLELACDQFTD